MFAPYLDMILNNRYDGRQLAADDMSDEEAFDDPTGQAPGKLGGSRLKLSIPGMG